MAKPPKDVTDYLQCIQVKDDYIRIWCVECNEWVTVALMFNATIVKTQMGGSKIIPLGDNGQKFVCRYCLADIEYLLSPHHKKTLEDKWL